jgi:nitrate reductase NapAB chaperone NapD
MEGFKMIISSMIVTTKTGKAEETALNLKRIPNVSTHGVYKGDNIIVVAEAEKEEDLVNLARYIMNEYPDVLGTFPTFISSDED